MIVLMGVLKRDIPKVRLLCVVAEKFKEKSWLQKMLELEEVM
jgi:hypothetical protein